MTLIKGNCLPSTPMSPMRNRDVDEAKRNSNHTAKICTSICPLSKTRSGYFVSPQFHSVCMYIITFLQKHANSDVLVVVLCLETMSCWRQGREGETTHRRRVRGESNTTTSHQKEIREQRRKEERYKSRGEGRRDKRE